MINLIVAQQAGKIRILDLSAFARCLTLEITVRPVSERGGRFDCLCAA
jgi:hypothetical protein